MPPVTVSKVAILVSDFEDGGVERNFTNLALGLSRLGVETCLVCGNPRHAYLQDLNGSAVRILSTHAERESSVAAVISGQRPDILVTGKLADDFAAVVVRSRLQNSGYGRSRLVAAVGTLLSGRFASHPWNPIKRFREIRRIGKCYRQLDGIAAISQGVADDLRQVFDVRGPPIRVLNNPILPETIEALASAPCSHPWLRSGIPGGPLASRPPVIVAVGGLRKVKDFATLLRAFARLTDRSVRLLILGDGKERGGLERLAEQLRITDRIDLHGFVPNPHAFVARSRVLVLSSRREGLGNVVVEALSVGTPVVVTDCSHGLTELLRAGGLGRMVPAGDPDALAFGLAAELRQSRDSAVLRTAAEPYRLLPAARAYLDFFRSLPS